MGPTTAPGSVRRVTDTSPARGVLFDLDGTLVDSLGDIGASMNDALVGLGLPPHADYRHRVGDGVQTLALRCLPPGQEARADELGRAYRARYAQRMYETTRPYPGIPELLDALAARAIPLAVVSNKPHAATVSMVAALLDRWRFQAVLGQRPDVPHKPHPAGALEAAALLGLPPADLLFVGDTDTDMRTAVAAGMRPCGALWGFRDEAELVATGARHLLRTPQDLLDLVQHAI